MPRRTTSLIINADDYGLSSGVTRAILDLLHSSCISNSTAMMCSHGSLDIQSAFRADVPVDHLGVHLQLTGGRPLLNASLTSLVDPDTGAFRGIEFIDKADPADVYAEWRAQITAFVALYGRQPSHIDTHYGVHQEARLLPVYVALAAEFGLPARSSGSGVATRLAEHAIPHVDMVYDDWTARGYPISALLERVKSAQLAGADSVEIVTHPGMVDAELQTKSRLVNERYDEYLTLKQLDSEALSNEGIELVTYGDLRS